MKKYLFLICVVSMSMGFTSCSNDESEGIEVASDNFSAEDIAAIKDFCTFAETTQKELTPTATKAVKRVRASSTGLEELTSDESLRVHDTLTKLGEKSIDLFKAIGISETDLEKQIPLKEKELYGLIGLEIYNEMSLDEMTLIGDKENGFMIVSNIDKEKAKHCFFTVLGVDIITIGDLFAQEYISKKALKKIVTTVIEKIVSRWATYAAGGAFSVAVFVAEWLFCYYG